MRRIETGARVGISWEVTSGLAEGERVIYEGLQKVQPGSVVAPTERPPAAPRGGDVQRVLHRPAEIRLRHLDRHHARRLISLVTLPVDQYPDITPPVVQVSASYPGANAQVVEATVAQPLEQQVNGVEGMIYIASTSGNDGT